MSVEVLRTIPEWKVLEQDWRRLLEQSDSDIPFMTWEWQEPWRKYFAAGKDLQVYVCRQGAAAVAILPFVVERSRRRKTELRTLKLFGAGLSDQLGLLVDPSVPEAIDRIAGELQARSGEWDVIELSDLDSENPVARSFCQAFRKLGLSVSEAVTSERPYLETAGRDWNTYFCSQRSTKTRKRKRNKLRKLQAQGELKLMKVTDPAGYLSSLERIIALQERDSYHGQERRRPFDGEAGYGFFREMGAAFAKNSWLMLWLSELDGRLLAYELGWRYKGRHFDYYGGFDFSSFKLSAGSLLKVRSLQSCFEDGVTAIDFLRGKHQWKQRWTEECRANVRLTIENPSLRSRVVRLAQAI